MVLKKSEEKEKMFIRPAKIAFRWCSLYLPLILISFAVLLHSLFPNLPVWGDVIAKFFVGLSMLSVMVGLLVIGLYGLYCSGRTETQQINLLEDVLIYSIYSGGVDYSEARTYEIRQMTRYQNTKRQFILYGKFKKKTKSNGCSIVTTCRKIRIPKTFVEEDKLIAFFNSHMV